MEVKNTREKDISKFSWTIVETMLCIGAISIVFAPLLFTKGFPLNSFLQTGQIGDTIGGITAPITGLLGAWLVYKALKAQIDANKLVTDQFTEQKILTIVIEQLKILREEINSFEAYLSGETASGRAAIAGVINSIPIRHYDVSLMPSNPFRHVGRQQEIVFFLESFCYLISLVTTSTLKPNDKANLLSLIRETYNSKLRDTLVKNEKKRQSKLEQCRQCTETHGIQERIFVLFDKIEAGITD